MKRLIPFFAAPVLALAACAPTRTVAGPPTPTPTHPAATTPKPTPEPTQPAESAAPGTAPREWQLLDESANHVPGISAKRAYTDLLAGMTPKRTVVVAVIDGGVDTAHVDLKANLWTNPKEIPGNGKDDDNNGYIDDVHGWDFIGGADGKDVDHDTFEVTRQYVADSLRFAGVNADTLTGAARADYQRYQEIRSDYMSKRADAQSTLQRLQQIDAVVHRADQILKNYLHTDSLTVEKVQTVLTPQQDVTQAKHIYLQLALQGANAAAVDEAVKSYEGQVKYGYNPSFNPRGIVGDDYADVMQRDYGNADVTGPDALHGTHVSGIIAAVRGNGIGIDGIAPDVRIMAVRAIPDGDERDKDVANAIRYAVDNGADIISMSFGKPYSPQKKAVDDAVRYADSHGVLMVHAAGNDGRNPADDSVEGNFPTPVYATGDTAHDWIEVGASSWTSLDSLAAPFSNWGKGVDVFAPGVDILSTVPGGYKRESGTSMATPVVSGLAALLMAYFPQLDAAQVKHIILASATRYTDQPVARPGADGGTVPFGRLSKTGGVVNAYAAVKMAEAETAGARQ